MKIPIQILNQSLRSHLLSRGRKAVLTLITQVTIFTVIGQYLGLDLARCIFIEIIHREVVCLYVFQQKLKQIPFNSEIFQRISCDCVELEKVNNV